MWYNDYVGIPFLAKGREKTGVDCWGLVRLVYSEQFNIELPSLAEDYTEDDVERIQELTAQYREGWDETTEPKPGSVILFKVLGHISHVGIYIGDNKFLHSRENHSAVVESLENITWQKRVAGFFNYSEKSHAVMNVVPHPLRTSRWCVPVPPGTSVAELSSWVLEEFQVSKEVESQVTIIINGRVIQKEDYLTTIIKDSDVIEYRSVAGKSSFLRIILTIAVLVVAANFGPGLIAAGTFGMSAGTASALGVAVVSTVGNLLIGYLMPIRPPESKNPGETRSQMLLNGGSNTANRYGAIPVVLGKMRMTAALGAENYIDSDTDNSYLNMLLVWGFGPLQVTDMRIGLNSTTYYEGGAGGSPVQSCTLNTSYFPPGTDYNDYNSFNNIYGSDRFQVYSGLTLVCHTSPSNVNVDYSDGFGLAGPWTEISLPQANTSRIDINFHFPQGLRRLRMTGKYAGDIYEKECRFGLQIRSIATTGGEATATAWGSGFGISVPATNIVVDQTEAGKYRWTRIAVGPSGIIVKVGPVITSPYAGLTLSPGSPFYSLYFNTSLVLRLPPVAANEYVIADVCMYGSSLYTIDYSARSGSIGGFGVTNAPIPYTNYAISSWGNPTAGADRGDYLISIASGYYYASGSYAYSLGTASSRQFVKRKDAFSYTVTIPTQVLASSRYYQIRVRRLNDDQVDDIADPGRNQDMHAIVLQTVAATANNKPIVEKAGWRLTRTALRIKANDQLNSRLEGVNAVVQTIAKTFNGTNWVYQPTSNPASLFLYVLEHPANAYRVLPGDLSSKVKLSEIATWYNFCASNGFEYNNILTDQRSILDVLRDICAAGRASPAMVDGMWTVVVDNQKSSIVQHFTPHNSWGFESTKRLPRTPDGLKVTYSNREKDWQQDEIRIFNTGKTAETAEVFEEINLPGITSYDLCAKHARWHLAQAALRPEIFTINTDLEYLVCNRGDRVKVLHDVPLWGIGSGRIKGILTDVVPTSISVVTGTATAYFADQVYAPYTVGSTITISGIPISTHNGDKIVTGCTSTSVSWATAITTNVVISGNKTVFPTGITVPSGTATATFASQGYVPFTIGTTIQLSGVTPSQYNGTKVVTSCSATTVSWTQVSYGTVTVAGSLVGLANFNSSTVVKTASITGTGSIVTATFTNQGYVPYAIGSTIVIAGVVPPTYNVPVVVTDCNESSVKWSSTLTTAITTHGTIMGTTVVNSNVSTLTPSVFELDEEVPLLPNINYTLRVRNKLGGSIVKTVQGNPIQDYYSKVKLTTASTLDEIDINDLFMFGELNTETQDLLVLAIEPYGYQNAKITLVDYAEELFTINYADNNFTVPDYDPQITLPPKNLVQSITHKPTITSVISNESVMEQVGPGVFKINIKVGFSNPVNLPSAVKFVQAQIDYDGDSSENWQQAVSVPVGLQSITITSIDELSIYKIRLRYASDDGRTGPWQNTITSAVAGAVWSTDKNTLTVETVSRHSFSAGTEVYLYNAQNTSLNNIYTVDDVTSLTSLSYDISRPTLSITTAATAVSAGVVTASYKDKNYVPYPVGSQILVENANPTTYRGIATVIDCDSEGVSWATGNSLLYTEDMTTWSQFSDPDTTVVYTTGVANSIGVNGVSKIQLATTTNTQRQISRVSSTVPANTVITISVEAKAAELSILRLYMGTKIVGEYPSATFDLSTGVVSSVNNTAGSRILNYGMESLSNGWYRCWISADVGSGTNNPNMIIQIPNTAGTIGHGFYVSRAQMNLGAYPSTYIPVLGATPNVLPTAATVQGKITSCVTTKSITQTGGVATATFTAQDYLSFAVGSSITISGAVPAGFNGTFIITVVTSTSISWNSSVVGPATTQGTIIRSAGSVAGTWTTSPAYQANENLSTGQGLTSSRNNSSGNFLSENLTHQVIGKTSPPGTVSNLTISPDYYTGTIKLSWSANSELDVQYYEVRRADENWGLETGRLLLGADLVYYGTPLGLTASTPATLAASNIYYVKAVDYSRNYSLLPASVNYITTRPAAVTSGTISYSYATTTSSSKTDTNVVFKWTAPTTSAFATAAYRVTLTKPGAYATKSITETVKDTTWATPANWLGEATITIETLDIIGIYSLPSTGIPVIKTAPQPPAFIGTPGVAGTSLVLNWLDATPGSMPIYGYEIRANNTGWGNNDADRLYYGSSTTFTKNIKPTAIGTTLNFYIRSIDVDDQYSETSTLTSYLVAAPVNTAFQTEIFTDTNLTNATVTLSWNPVTPIFGLSTYELTYVTIGGTTVTQTLSSTALVIETIRAWNPVGYGSVTFSIKVVDNLGNKSTGVSKVIQKSRPNPVTSFSAKVIDNTVLLTWATPAKSTLPIDHYNIVKGSSYTSSTPIGEKTGTFTSVVEQIGGNYTYWIVPVDTDGQVGDPFSVQATVNQSPDYIFNAEYNSSFTRINTTVTNTYSTSNIRVLDSKNMYTGLALAFTGTTFGGLVQGVYYVVSVIDSSTITISPYSDLNSIFVASSTASGSMSVREYTGTLGVNTNCLITENFAILPVNTTTTFADHFAPGTSSRSWAGPNSQVSAGFPYFIQPAENTGYYEEVFNYTKLLGSSQITVLPTFTIIGSPTVITIISTGQASAGTQTLTNTVGNTTITVATGTGNTGGLVAGNYITIPATPTGQTVRIVSAAAGSITVTPAVILANTAVNYFYVPLWTDYSTTTALGVNFQYVKVRITVSQGNTGNLGTGTITIATGVAAGVAATVAGSGTAFNSTFKIGDTIVFGSPSQTATVTSIANAASMTITNATTAITAVVGGSTYKYFGTDLYKLTALSAKLDAKQITETGSITTTATGADAIVNFTNKYTDVSAISLTPKGTTPIIGVYNYIDTNMVATYSMSSSTTCLVTTSSPATHNLKVGQQVALIIITGAAVGTYITEIVTLPNTNQFTAVIGSTPYTTTGIANVYPQSMTVHAFSDAGTRVAAEVSYTARGF